MLGCAAPGYATTELRSHDVNGSYRREAAVRVCVRLGLVLPDIVEKVGQYFTVEILCPD